MLDCPGVDDSIDDGLAEVEFAWGIVAEEHL